MTVLEKALDDCRKIGLYLEIFDREEFKAMSVQRLTYEESLANKYEAGLYHGKEEGISIGKIEGMILLDTPTNKITELTGASLEKIEEVRKNMK